ncbi:dimethyl sulfoxide reductase anchor subunit family protein [Desulfuribacillus alkaliarsenatis]|nr:DmsC/YnfH family molybdoenzyme membrane anchor subunit [Desulfuribacillus alkaliarsenatis]
MSEITLVLFTVLTQLAVGALVTLWLLETLGKKVKVETGKFLTTTVLGITAVGIVISLFHLGSPAMAFLALSNIANSWLSREILMFGLFFVAALVYLLQWKEGQQQARKIVGCVTAIIGTVAVMFSGMIYVLPAMPAWNNFSPVLFFLVTAFLLGPIYTFMVLRFKDDIEAPKIPVAVSVVLGFSIISFVLYLTTMQAGVIEQNLTAVNIIASEAFWLRAAVGWLLPLGILGYFAYKQQKMTQPVVITVFLLLLVGELVGRELFYSAIVGMQIGL